MAHEVDKMLSVFETPWHKHLTRERTVILQAAPNLEEALVIAGLDWEVETRRSYVKDKDPATASIIGADTFVEAKGFKNVVRLDTQQVLGAVREVYTPLQNAEAFGVLEPMLDSGLCTIETAGSLREGVDVWMLVKFVVADLLREALEGDGVDEAVLEGMFAEVAPFGLITNNHAGSRKVMLRETPIRVVCANTLDFALRDDADGLTIQVVHSASVAENVKSSADILFGNIAKRYSSIAEKRERLKATELRDQEFNLAVLDPAVPIRHLERKIQRREDTPGTRAAHTRASDKRNRISNLWTTGIDHTGDRSAWEAYQGLVQALDHDDAFAPRGGDEGRLKGIFDGQLVRTKRRSFRRLHALSTADREGRLELVESWS